jgi:tungstate transport system substrate-binding protein
MSSRWALGVGAALAAAVAAVVLGASTAAAPARQDLIVQSTTSVRDSGVLEQLIAPQFKKRFPQYNLKFIAVGTGQAITNARAGQADVLIGHSPALERRFVADGYSYEPVGRTVMWNDFVIVGPASDPAGVLKRARHDAAGAFEAIAAAGAAGRAHFVSRGDDSGTNTKELGIWGMSRVAHDARNEPAAPWYRKAGLGMADTLRLTQQCPFAGGRCYTITDRGTLHQLMSNRAITRLSIVMDRPAPRARGGRSLMLNVYNAYAISPRKYPKTHLRAALAFMDVLTSEGFQGALATFPTARRPGFFPAALPRVTLTQRLPRSVPARSPVVVRGRVASAVPGAAPLSGIPLRLTRLAAPAGAVALDRATARSQGTFRMRARLTRGGELFITTPRFRNLSPVTVSLGRVTVKARAAAAGTRLAQASHRGP